MLTKMTRGKLVVFALITAVALTVMALYYVRLPQQVGIGRYDVSVELANAGGIYPQAMVTYRGVEVGKVASVELGAGGHVIAHLQIDDGTRIPAGAATQVRSASVIGEQYVNFLPTGADAGSYLHAGSVVPVSQTSIPTTTNALLTSVNSLLKSVPLKDLDTTVSELGKAFSGTGDSLGRTLDASVAFNKVATRNLPATLRLIDDAQPVLRTQRDMIPSIRAFSRSVDSFTGQLARSDRALRGLLAAGPGFMNQVSSFSDGLKGQVPPMLTDLAGVGNVVRVYIPAVHHILTVLPAELNMFMAAVPQARMKDPRTPATLWFKLGVDPSPCTTGFADANRMRNPDDFTSAPPPTTSYCKVSRTSPQDARGAHNYMCPNGNRGASALQCGYDFTKFSVGSPTGYRVTPGVGDGAGSTTEAGAPLAPSFLTTGGDTGPVKSLEQLLTGVVR